MRGFPLHVKVSILKRVFPSEAWKAPEIGIRIFERFGQAQRVGEIDTGPQSHGPGGNSVGLVLAPLRCQTLPNHGVQRDPKRDVAALRQRFELLGNIGIE